MEKIIRWQAFDGEQFETEEACYEYESRILRVAKTITFLTSDGTRILCEDANDIAVAYDCCDMIRVADVPTWREDIERAVSYWGFGLDSNVNEPGTYIYDWDRWEWTRID